MSHGSTTRIPPETEKASTSALRIGDPNSAFEREADRIADQVMAGEIPKRDWSLTLVSFGHTLHRKCACAGSSDSMSECDKCNKRKLLRRKPAAANAPDVAPPIVDCVLNSAGRPLDRATRTFFEPRFGMDLGNVQVHDDSRAAKSAEAVNAHAYTVGNSIVFGAGRYRPDSAEGRRLLAHELTHVMHQRDTAGPLVQREEKPETEVVEPPKTGSLMERAFDAADATRWQEAAELANGLKASDLKAFIAALGAGWKIEQLHIGAINNPRVGRDSQVAKATRSAFLNAKFAEQMKGGFYQAASEFLNGFSETEIRGRVAKMKTEVVAGLHQGALAHPGVGPQSNAAKVTAEELNKRKEKGDAAADAATKPIVEETPLERKKRCQDTGGQGFKVFPLRLPKGMWQISNAPITAELKGDEILVKQPFNEVKGDSMFRRETRTLPLETFLGGIRLKKDDVVGVRLYDDKERLVCVTAEDMLKFSEATDMALWFSVARTALDAATVVAPGASAGVGKAMGYGAANILAGQALEVGRQEMEVHYGLREEVDWGGIAFETAFQLATLGFSKYLNNAATKAVLGKAPELGQKPVQLAIQAAVQGGIGLFHAAARTAFDLLRKEKKKFVMEEFLLQLAQEFATGALFAFVAGAAHHEEGLPQQKKGAPVEPEPGATPAPRHEEVPTPQAKPQKKVATPVEEPPPALQHEEAPAPQAKPQKKVAAPVEEPPPASQPQKKTAVPEEATPTQAGMPEEPAPAISKDKKKVRASEKTEDGHEVVVTDEGVGRCSPPPCPVIRVEYKKELKTNPELKQWEKIVQGLRKNNPELAASEGKKLIAALEEARASGGSVSPDVAARHRQAMLDSRIAAVDAELPVAREATLSYQAERTAAGESMKGGPSKRIWNLKESKWVALRQKAFPDRTILEQATIVGVKDANGKMATTKTLAGSGRIADFVEVRGSKFVAGDIKSAEEFMGSVQGGVKTGPVEAELRATSKIAQQHDVEGKVLQAAQAQGSKIVITGRDVATGKKMTIEVDAANYASEVVTYTDVKPN